MANLTTEGFGFIPVDPIVDGSNIVYCFVPSSDGTALGIGDAVKKVGTANTAKTALAANRVAGMHGLEIGQLPVVTTAVAGATNKVWGIVMGVMLDHNDFSKVHYRPASTDAVVKVLLLRDSCRLRVKSDAAVPAASIGLNVNISTITTASTVFGKSKMLVDGANAAADVTYQFKIVGIGRDPSNSDLAAAGVELHVVPNVGYDVHPDVGL